MPTTISFSVAAMARYERSLPGVRKAYMDVDAVKGRMLRTVRAGQSLVICAHALYCGFRWWGCVCPHVCGTVASSTMWRCSSLTQKNIRMHAVFHAYCPHLPHPSHRSSPLPTRVLCAPEDGPAPRGGDHGGARRAACPAWAPPPAALHRGPSMRGATRFERGTHGACRLPPRRPAGGGELDARVGGCRILQRPV